MKKLFFTLAVAGAAVTAANAQTETITLTLKKDLQCGFNKVIDRTHTSYPELLAAYRATAAANGHVVAAKGTGVVYDIPVVFHIVYPAGAPSLNIPDSVVTDQLSVLNKAFRHRHADTANARAFFKPLAGDAEIQFHLATIDPQGNATNGITRTASARTYFGSATGDLDSLERIKSTAAGGIDPWPTTRYLNIWVGHLADAQGQLSVLGYGIPPLNPLPGNWPAGTELGLTGLKDGVVLQSHCLGSNSALNPALQGIYTKGRAAVHEVGHYLGLQHVFGGNGGGAPSCGSLADDGISDTPVQSTNSFDQGMSCPSSTKNSCGSGVAGDLPDMWENYMAYARDACQILFTHEQITVIRNVLGNQRNGLVNPNATSIATTARPGTVSIYPNPAREQIAVLYPGNIQKATVRNFLGQQLAQYDGAAAQVKTYDISTLPNGNYILLLEADGRQLVNKFTVLR